MPKIKFMAGFFYTKRMERVLIRLEDYYKQHATNVEKEVLAYILANPKQAAKMDIHALAEKGYCSAATLVRISKKAGFSGFRELKRALNEELGYRASMPRSHYNKDLTDETRIEHILYEDMKAIQSTFDLLEMPVVEAVVSCMSEAPTIFLFGIGASFLVIKDFAMKCVRINKPVSLFEDLHLQLVISNNIRPGDFCLIASYSGKTPEMIRIAENVKKHQGTLIAITQYSSNPISELADHVLYVPKIEEALRVGASSSRISQLAVIDILFHTYLSRHLEGNMDRIESSQRLLDKEPKKKLDPEAAGTSG